MKSKVNKARKPRRNATCYFTESGTKPDYKDVLILRRFISDRGKIIPQKYSGLTAKNQRMLSSEVKKARYMALLPYTDKHSI